MKDRTENRIAALVLLLYSVATRTIASIHSILFNKDVIDCDAACFVVIGREILKGKVLYKDIFDHKTPYIYLIHGLASLIDFNHLGLFLVEVVVLFVTLYFIYKILLIIFENAKFHDTIKLSGSELRVISLIGAFIMGVALSNYNITEGYYRTEPFVVSLVLPAVYLLAKYYYGKTKILIISKHMFIIGLLAGLTFMINIKGIVLFVPLVIPLAFDFIKQKQWFGLLKTFCLGLFGVIIAILPYVIYMIVTDSVKDMIFAVWDTNLAYANDYMVYEASSQAVVKTISTKDGIVTLIIAFMMKYPYIMTLITLAIAILFVLNNNKQFKIALCLQIIILFLMTFSVGRPHAYYLYTFLPYLIVIYILLVKVFVNRCGICFNGVKMKLNGVLIIVISILLSLGINYSRNNNSVKKMELLCIQDAEELRDVVKKYDPNYNKLKILAFGFLPEVYLWLDADIHYKYFVRPFMSYNAYRFGIDEQVKYINKVDPDIFCIRNFDLVPRELEMKVLFTLNYYYDMIGECREFYVYGKKRQ